MDGTEIEFDEAKRQSTLTRRGLDFIDSWEVFEGAAVTLRDGRRSYGEIRYQTFGRARGGAILMVVWTPRKDRRRIISMRKCNAEERAWYLAQIG